MHVCMRACMRVCRNMISLSFGRKNAFSDAFDRGFAMRGKVYSMRSDVCATEKRRIPYVDISAKVRASSHLLSAPHVLLPSSCARPFAL